MSERLLKLHQVLAIESNVRSQAQKDLTAAHHGLQKGDLLFGLSKSYKPLNEDGEKLPSEEKILQVKTPDVLRETSDILTKLYDVVAARDFANCSATADVVLDDGNIILKNAPATFLLWLEKKLDDLHTFVSKLPILPADTDWDFDPNQNCFKSKVIETTRTQKIPYPLVLAQATDKHPAQVVEKTRDEIVGTYSTIKYSGAMKAKDVAQMKERVEQLQKAVKFAREKANTVDAPKKEVGKNILEFVFGQHLSV